MEKTARIPMFPLAILPLPGELVPLHIFEPRYRQLLKDIETSDVVFGIYCSHEVNARRVGSLVRLESVIKRYHGGESDIVVKCLDNFTLDKLFRTFQEKMYPGGDVSCWETDIGLPPGQPLSQLFLEYLRARNIHQHLSAFSLFQIANELTLDVNERYKFLICSALQKRSLLINKVRFLMHVLKQEETSKDIFHLN